MQECLSQGGKVIRKVEQCCFLAVLASPGYLLPARSTLVQVIAGKRITALHSMESRSNIPITKSAVSMLIVNLGQKRLYKNPGGVNFVFNRSCVIGADLYTASSGKVPELPFSS